MYQIEHTFPRQLTGTNKRWVTEPKIVVACHFVRLTCETKATSPQIGGITQKLKSDAVFTKLSRKRKAKA